MSISWGTQYAKLKTNLRLANNRLKLMGKKKTEMAMKARTEIADFISAGKPDRARIRVEHIIREDFLVEAFELLEAYCDLMLARFGLIEQMKTLDDGIAEAVISVLWAAPRITQDIPEFKIISDQLTGKYGKPFAEAARANQLEYPAKVAPKLVAKLAITAPPKLLVERYLIEIASAAGIPFTPDADVMRDDEVAQAEKMLIDFKNQQQAADVAAAAAGGGMGGPGGPPPPAPGGGYGWNYGPGGPGGPGAPPPGAPPPPPPHHFGGGSGGGGDVYDMPPAGFAPPVPGAGSVMYDEFDEEPGYAAPSLTGGMGGGAVPSGGGGYDYAVPPPVLPQIGAGGVPIGGGAYPNAYMHNSGEMSDKAAAAAAAATGGAAPAGHAHMGAPSAPANKLDDEIAFPEPPSSFVGGGGGAGGGGANGGDLDFDELARRFDMLKKK